MVPEAFVPGLLLDLQTLLPAEPGAAATTALRLYQQQVL